MEEIWKDVDGYEGRYKVSNTGKVIGTRKFKSPSRKYLVQVEDKYGYLRVCLFKDGKRTNALVHRLVANAFLPKVSGKEQINHLDENKKNNRLENLEWVDTRENSNYGTRNVRISKSKLNTNCKKVIQFDKNLNEIMVWPSICEVKRELGYETAAISRCCLGKQETSYGYIWRHA